MEVKLQTRLHVLRLPHSLLRRLLLLSLNPSASQQNNHPLHRCRAKSMALRTRVQIHLAATSSLQHFLLELLSGLAFRDDTLMLNSTDSFVGNDLSAVPHRKLCGRDTEVDQPCPRKKQTKRIKRTSICTGGCLRQSKTLHMFVLCCC